VLQSIFGVKMTTTRDDNRTSPVIYAWCVVGVLLVAYIVSMMDRQILSLMVQPIRKDLGISDLGISLLHGFAFVICYSLFGIALARFADRHHRRNLIIVGMIVWCVATAACGLARNFGELFLARVFVGIGEASLTPAAYSIIADYFQPPGRARALSVYTMGNYMGGGLALMFGGLLISNVLRGGDISVPLLGILRSWQVAFIAVGLPGLLAAALMLVVREPVRRERAPHGGDFSATVAFFRKNARILLLLYGAFGLDAMVIQSLTAWLPTYFIRNFGWSTGPIGITYGLILCAAGSTGIATGGWTADRLISSGRKEGALYTAVGAVALLAAVVAVIGTAGSPNVSLLALTATIFLVSIPIGLAPTILCQIAPNEFRGQTLSLSMFLGSLIGMGSGPLAVASLTVYVFHSEHALGKSLSIVTEAAALGCLTLLTLALRTAYQSAASNAPTSLSATIRRLA
jgi:MFS family permease